MNYFSWLAQEELLTSEALTVRAQALPPNDRDQLLWPTFFPRADADSMKARDITDVDFRPISDRREWNTRGRAIPLITPSISELEFIPVESYFKLGEQEIQHLVERTLGNEALFRQIIGSTVPGRVASLVDANQRRLEMDAMTAWSLGQVTVMNPQTGVTVTVSYNFDTNRYQTAGTAWNDAGLNAYNEFLAWVEDGVDAVGPVIGAVMRRATFNAIQADAPQGIDAIRLTRAQVQDRISQDLGFDFNFFIHEGRADKFTDGGLAYSRVNYWPAEKVALVPTGAVVGSMQHAPVARAYELARLSPDAKINVRGMTVYREVANGGRELTTECQINAFPMPTETRLWVIDAGV